MMLTNKTGVWGEIFASRLLRDKGYEIVAANYYCRFGELDLVAIKDGIICFVEVKTRNQNTGIRPMEAVDEGKQDRIKKTAKHFINFSKFSLAARFDVCEVYLDDNDRLVCINYMKNAF